MATKFIAWRAITERVGISTSIALTRLLLGEHLFHF